MKREDMGNDVLPPTRPTRNPRIEKIFVPLPQSQESRFSQAGKALEGIIGRIHISSCVRPHSQYPHQVPIRADPAALTITERPRRTWA